MKSKQSVYRGCLLGLAAGDALGLAADGKTYDRICRDYGQDGLRGYDLFNGCADISSHTQIAAFAANGLLVGGTRGQIRGHMAPFVQYIGMALKEWNQVQNTRRAPARPLCWVSRVPEFRTRRCMDNPMRDMLSRPVLGTPEEPVSRASGAGSLCAVIPVGLFFHPDRMNVRELGRLGAETVALTHGDPSAFLAGSALSYIITGIIQEPELPLEKQFTQAGRAVEALFGKQYPQASQLCRSLIQTVRSAKDSTVPVHEALDANGCESCAQVLCGAVYAVLAGKESFDSSLIAAVNHSGRSAAVGAVTGAILGAVCGEENLPDFYLDGLVAADPLRVLADDLAQNCPMERSSRLFDDEWDRKYNQGEPVFHSQWDEI